MYIGNGKTTAFPLPEGVDGMTVYLAGRKAGLDEYAVAVDGSHILFNTPPPEGAIIAFTPPPPEPEPDENVQELLIEAKRERDKAKRILREADETVKRAEAIIKAAGIIAEDRLNLRLEKYAELADKAVTGAAMAAEENVKNYVNAHIVEVRKKHQEVKNLYAKVLDVEEAAKNAASAASEATEEKVKNRLEAYVIDCFSARDEVLEISAEIRSIRNEVTETCSKSALGIIEAGKKYMDSVLEETKALRTAAARAVEAETATAKRLAGETAEARDAAVKAAAEATASLATPAVAEEETVIRQIVPRRRERVNNAV
jgi:flagellin-specific chaperone FliS